MKLRVTQAVNAALQGLAGGDIGSALAGVARLIVNVDKAGVLGFEIRAAKDHPLYDASRTDMFASAMQRLNSEGILVNQIRGAWEAGTDSVNTAKYLKNIADGMSRENAALNTWTGQISKRYGYEKFEKIESIGGLFMLLYLPKVT